MSADDARQDESPEEPTTWSSSGLMAESLSMVYIIRTMGKIHRMYCSHRRPSETLYTQCPRRVRGCLSVHCQSQRNAAQVYAHRSDRYDRLIRIPTDWCGHMVDEWPSENRSVCYQHPISARLQQLDTYATTTVQGGVPPPIVTMTFFKAYQL